MTSSKTFANLPRLIFMLTAGVVLLATTEGALAKNGGNSNDRGGMKNSSSEHKDKDRGEYKDKDRSAYK
jgi:hypothetical protein